MDIEINTAMIIAGIKAQQTTGVIGADCKKKRELCEDVAKEGIMLLHLNFDHLLTLSNEVEVGSFLMKKMLDQTRCLIGDKKTGEIEDRISLYREPVNAFKYGFTQLSVSIAKRTCVVIDNYEYVLSLPKKMRHCVIGGPTFELCENWSCYNSSALIFSRCPLWWCEYDENPNVSSVVYQRTIDYPLSRINMALRDEIAMSVPAEDRAGFTWRIRDAK